MNPLLSPAGLRRLRKFARSRTALILDYDGTLCPIVPRAVDAAIPPRTKRLLRKAAALYPTAILSGRKLSDVRARVGGCGIREVVGNHGLEWRGSRDSVKYERLMYRCMKAIERAMREGVIHGERIEVEYKKVTLSVHYRMSPNRVRARREILGVLRGFAGTQIIEGKQVFNLLPHTRLNKGTAVVALRRKFRCDRAIYVGDDWTDEKVFELRPKPFLLDIHMGRSTRSRARYYLPNLAAMERFLEELIELRSGIGSSPFPPLRANDA